jgi:LPS export ABC transporter protein LptC
MQSARRPLASLRPLKWITALRVALAAVLVAFTVLLFLSFGKKDEAPVRIHLSAPAGSPGEKVVDLSDNFDIIGTKGGREAFRLKADQVTGFEGDRKILRGVHLEVYSQDGERMILTGSTAQFEMSARRARLSGDVLLAGKNGFSLRTESLYYDGERDVIFTPEEIAFETGALAGTGRGLNYLTTSETLKIPSAVRVTAKPAAPGEPPTEVTSSDLTLALRTNEVVFSDAVRLTRGPDTLAGNYLKAVFSEDRSRVVSLQAYGDVEAGFVAGREAVRSLLKTDSLEAAPSPDGTLLDRVSAHGGCRLESQGIAATSEHLEAVLAQDSIALRGEPVVVDDRSRIAAREIDLFPSRRSLEARGDVKTTFRGSPTGSAPASPAFFSGRDPVHFQSERLTVEDGGLVARFTGGARGWQGNESIQAEELLLHFADRRMRAFRSVLCRFTPESAPGATGTGGPTGTIVASSMDYDEAEGVVHFRDAVRLRRGDSTIEAERMDATVAEPGAAPRRITQVLATGDVRFEHLANTGVADRLLYTPGTEVAEMQRDGGLAEVVDRTNGRVLRGRTLTFDLRGNRVLTETTGGGRTWITLSSKERERPRPEPKIGH